MNELEPEGKTPTVAVVTDSTAGIPEAMMDSLHIKTVAYYLHRGHEILRDLITIKRDEFLRWLPSARVAPTTAAPGPGDYLQAYEELIGEGASEIISIHMGSKISAAYESASAARSMLLQKHPQAEVEVIDSRNAALCQGWMAIQAARAAAAGMGFQSIVALVKKLVPISHMIQTADTLRYLYLGGRIGKAQSLLGSMLNIKPLIGLEDGVIVPLGRTHSRRQAYAAMADMAAAVIGEGTARIGYLHAGAPEEALKVKEQVEAKVRVVESIIGELTPVLAVHTGPGMAGLCYYRVED
jgi:fatty acid kinase fatty acid binding subunit